MSGGVAYVYDEDGTFARRCNTAMVSLEKVLPAAEQEAQMDRAVWHRQQHDEALLKNLIQDHHKWTGSLRARQILDHWAESRGRFVKVFPNEYKRALKEIGEARVLAAGQEASTAVGSTIAAAKVAPLSLPVSMPAAPQRTTVPAK